MEVILSFLAEVTPADLEGLSFTDLEWILADFVTSWGQRLPLDPASWPPPGGRLRLHNFGRRYLPFSTAADFPAVSPDQVRTLALAVSSYGIYILLLDAIVDEPENVPAAIKLTLQHLLSHSQRWYRTLFPANSPFWPEAEQRALTTTRAMWQEYYHHNGVARPFSIDEFRRIATDELAIIQINPVGLATLNGTPELIPNLTTCWNAIGLAAIVLDDIRDWRQDYEADNFTYLLTQALLTSPLRAQVEARDLPSISKVGTAVFFAELPESLYKLAYDELEAAAGKAETIHCLALASLSRQLQVELKNQLDKLTQRKLEALLMAA